MKVIMALSLTRADFGYHLRVGSLFILILSACLGVQIGQDDKNNLDEAKTIPGRAGIDYPILSRIPTNFDFDCHDHDYAGYFADVKYDCQVYHVCFPDNRNATFLCSNGTIFNQRNYVCDWWHRFNCSHAPSLYELNLFKKPLLAVVGPPTLRVQPVLTRTPKASLDLRNIRKLTVPGINNENKEPKSLSVAPISKEKQTSSKPKKLKPITLDGLRKPVPVLLTGKPVPDLLSGKPVPDLLSGKPVPDLLSGKPVPDLLSGKPVPDLLSGKPVPDLLSGKPVPDLLSGKPVLVSGKPRPAGTLIPPRPNRSSQAQNGRQVFFDNCSCNNKKLTNK